MRTYYISTSQLKEAADLALWEIENGENPGEVVLRLMMRFREIADFPPTRRERLARWLRRTFANRRHLT